MRIGWFVFGGRHPNFYRRNTQYWLGSMITMVWVFLMQWMGFVDLKYIWGTMVAGMVLFALAMAYNYYWWIKLGGITLEKLETGRNID